MRTSWHCVVDMTKLKYDKLCKIKLTDPSAQPDLEKVTIIAFNSDQDLSSQSCLIHMSLPDLNPSYNNFTMMMSSATLSQAGSRRFPTSFPLLTSGAAAGGKLARWTAVYAGLYTPKRRLMKIIQMWLTLLHFWCVNIYCRIVSITNFGTYVQVHTLICFPLKTCRLYLTEMTLTTLIFTQIIFS